MLDLLDNPIVNRVASYLVTAAGAGMLVKTVIERRVPNIETAAERAAKREETEDASRDKFRDELRERIEKQDQHICSLEEKHKECEEARRIANDKCAADRAVDREEMASLRGQVAVLRDSAVVYNSPNRRAPHVKTKARKKA